MTDSTNPNHFESKDQTDLYYYFWPAKVGEPKGTVQICHGMAEHGARYQYFAHSLNEAGWNVLVHDQRGHGKSIVRLSGYPGDIKFSQLAADIDDLWLHVADKHDLPQNRVLFGHSMGSFIAQYVSMHSKASINGLILSASNYQPPKSYFLDGLVLGIEKLRLTSVGKSKLIHRMTFEKFNNLFAPTRTECDWLSRDEQQVDNYIADELCGFQCTLQLWSEVLKGLKHISSINNLRRIRPSLPIFLFAGTDDPVGKMGRGPKALQDVLKQTSHQNVELKLYEGGRHEMLNETNQDQVIADNIQWLETLNSQS